MANEPRTGKPEACGAAPQPATRFLLSMAAKMAKLKLG